jgi:hypothetical protein
MYNDPNCKPWTSRSWTPVGYSSRRDFILQIKTVETKKTTFDSGYFENENEKSKENLNEKGNGVRVAASVSSVNSRSSSILGNEGSGVGSGVDIIGDGVDV